MIDKIAEQEDFLDSSDFVTFKDFVLHKNSTVEKNTELVTYFWEKYRNKFLSLDDRISGLTEFVTITNSNKPISLHRDHKLDGSFWKILIYLNDIEDGGTIFLLDEEERIVQNKANKLVIFDMDLFHKSQNFKATSTKNKLCIGFRANKLD